MDRNWTVFWISAAAGIVVLLISLLFQKGCDDTPGPVSVGKPGSVSGRVNVRLGEGNITDLRVKVRGDMMELTFGNKLWLSSLLVSYDGASKGKMRQGDRMTLAVPATPGTHRLQLVGERGSYDAGRRWHRDIIVE